MNASDGHRFTCSYNGLLTALLSRFSNLEKILSMSIEQIIDVPPGGQLTIQLPSSMKNKKRVKLIINDVEDSLENKIALLQKASADEDFLADMHEVNRDFEFAESKIE